MLRLDLKRLLAKIITKFPVVVSGNSGSFTVSASGYKNAEITPTKPAGKTLVGVVETHINGTNSSYCQIIGSYVYGDVIHVQMKNTSSGSVTWNVDATGLYM